MEEKNWRSQKGWAGRAREVGRKSFGGEGLKVTEGGSGWEGERKGQVREMKGIKGRDDMDGKRMRGRKGNG